MKKGLSVLTLTLLYGALVFWVVPEDAVYGSQTDWLSQHVALAETIRNVCVAQHTLLPDWIELGSGVNGYQFAYYGFLRLDVIVGTLLPEIPMMWIFMAYALVVGLASVLLCEHWLYLESGRRDLAWVGAVLVMTAGAMFHLHRQIMFVAALPFLLLALILWKTARRRWLPLCVLMICTSSFYYAPACLIVLAWYSYRLEGWRFWRPWLKTSLLGVGMAAALLLPAASVLLEHRSGTGSRETLATLLTPDWSLSGLLVDAYGMGVSLLALYALLAGLAWQRLRADCLFLLTVSALPLVSYLLNATLYARPKILIPFLPLVILQVVRFLMASLKACRSPLWPFLLIVPLLAFWRDEVQWPWMLAETVLLLMFVLLLRWRVPTRVLLMLLLIAPIGLYQTTAATEQWVSRNSLDWMQVSSHFKTLATDARYHYDSLLAPRETANVLPAGTTRSSMYSSVTNQAYTAFYYDILQAPIQINNRVALLSADDPFLFHLLGTRYLETTADRVPAGYSVLAQKGDVVLAENPNVLPRAYVTDDVVAQEWFDALSAYEKRDVLARKTVVASDAAAAGISRPPQDWTPKWQLVTPVPDGFQAEREAGGWHITADRDVTLTFHSDDVPEKDTLFWQFEVDNATSAPVVISADGIKNKLSGKAAPYPNGNHCFHYKLPASNTWTLHFSAGDYHLRAMRWYQWDSAQFAEKRFTPLELSQNLQTGTLLSGQMKLAQSGFLATTIPLQRGLTMYVDGKETQICAVNTAFVGVKLTAGSHNVCLVFEPPGKRLGCLVSILSMIVYIIALLLKSRKRIVTALL